MSVIEIIVPAKLTKMSDARDLLVALAKSLNELQKENQALRKRIDAFEKGATIPKGVKLTKGGKVKKEKKAKDPNAPIKPASSYILWQKDKVDRKDIKARLEAKGIEADRSAVMGEIGRMWKDLSPKEKAPYEQEAKELKEKLNAYNEAKKGEESSGSETKKVEEETKKEETKKVKEAVEVEEVDPPAKASAKKKPPSDFILWKNQNIDRESIKKELKEKGMEVNQKTINKKISKMWEDLKENNTNEWYRYHKLANDMKMEYYTKSYE